MDRHTYTATVTDSQQISRQNSRHDLPLVCASSVPEILLQNSRQWYRYTITNYCYRLSTDLETELVSWLTISVCLKCARDSFWDNVWSDEQVFQFRVASVWIDDQCVLFHDTLWADEAQEP